MATPSEDLGATSQQIGDLEARSQELDANYRQALTELVAVDSEVSRYSTDISEITQRRADTQAAIVGEQARLDEYQSRLTERVGALEKRLRGTYKSNDVGYLEVMMGAGDFSDFLNRVDMINLIADEDRELIVSVQDAKQGIEEKIASLSEMQNQLAASIEELSAAQGNLLGAQNRQQSFVSSLEYEKLSADGQLAQLQAEAADIEARMNQIQQSAESSDDSGGYVENPSPPSGGGSSSTFESTAYCLGGTTATGMPVGRGIIAVDPSVIPLGSRVHVSGYGDAIAADTGGAIQGNIIDVWLPCGEAYSWGRRTVTVTVY
ncbi:MAG: 3D domain-containing protein [Thermoleophilia bacterium]|nr:3D domain-containing protein [Thermoleophilia bacterium]